MIPLSGVINTLNSVFIFYDKCFLQIYPIIVIQIEIKGDKFCPKENNLVLNDISVFIFLFLFLT